MNILKAPSGPSRDSERGLTQLAGDYDTLVLGSRGKVAETLPTPDERAAEELQDLWDYFELLSDAYEDEK